MADDLPPVDAYTAARWLGVAPGTIWRWAHEGRIASVGKSGRRKLYDLGELNRVERETRTRAGRKARSVVGDETGAAS